MRIWIEEIASAVPFRVRWDWPGSNGTLERPFETELEARGFATGFCAGFALAKDLVPATPHFSGHIGTRSKFLPVAPGYGHTPREAAELNRPKGVA